jgi:hypothetical protein
MMGMPSLPPRPVMASVKLSSAFSVTQTKQQIALSIYHQLGLAVNVQDRFEANFEKRGILDNDLLGVPQESVEEVVARVRKGH